MCNHQLKNVTRCDQMFNYRFLTLFLALAALPSQEGVLLAAIGHPHLLHGAPGAAATTLVIISGTQRFDIT